MGEGFRKRENGGEKDYQTEANKASGDLEEGDIKFYLYNNANALRNLKGLVD